MVKLNETLYWYTNDAVEMSKYPNSTIKEILDAWRVDIWTHNIQNEKQQVKNIKSLKSFKILVPRWATDRFKEALDQYIKGMWVSSIILSGIIAEFYVWWLLEIYIKREGIAKIIESSESLNKNRNRIALVKTLELVDNKKKRT